jgi:hypothetical protein
MKCAAICLLLLSIFVYVIALPSEAQVATGVPAFNSFGGGPFDTVNLGNLNIHFMIPILHKAGRGIPFNYDLTYESSIWQIATVNGQRMWEPVQQVGGVASYWGFQGLGPVYAPYVQYSAVNTTGSCGPPGTNYSLWTYSNYVYHDAAGASHPFSAGASNFQCSNGQSSSSPTGKTSYIASDGSGYTLTYNISGGGVYTSGTITTVDGTIRNVPFLNSPPNTSTPYTATDRNGNKITFSNGVYTDTLGKTVLTAQGTAPNNTTFSYTPPTGVANSAKYTVSYKQYTVETVFECSDVNDYFSTAYLVDRVTLPDNTYYQFGYENTSENTGPSGPTTGRLTTVILPTGGSIDYDYPATTDGLGMQINCADGTAPVTPLATGGGLSRGVVPTSGGVGQGEWQYARGNAAGNAYTTIISDPVGNVTTIQFQKDSASSTPTYGFFETQRQVNQGPQTLLETKIKCYNVNYANCTTTAVSSPIRQTDVYSQLLNGSTRLSETVYNGNGFPTDDKEYNYGVATGSAPSSIYLVRETATTYANLSNQIVDKPASITVSDWSSGTAVTLASLHYTYDQGTPAATSGTPQHVAIVGSRGNLTTLTKATSTTASLSSTMTYYDTGNPHLATDVNGSQTSYV